MPTPSIEIIPTRILRDYDTRRLSIWLGTRASDTYRSPWKQLTRSEMSRVPSGTQALRRARSASRGLSVERIMDVEVTMTEKTALLSALSFNEKGI